MKLILAKSNATIPPAKLMRLAGFIYIVDKKFGKDSYSRPLGRNHYPRFHSYINDTPEQLIINLHLDQKEASYEGFKRHSGEYDGQAVEQEIIRIKALALAAGYQIEYRQTQPVEKFQPVQAPEQRPIATLGSGDFNSAASRYQPKKSWWRKFFGM